MDERRSESGSSEGKQSKSANGKQPKQLQSTAGVGAGTEPEAAGEVKPGDAAIAAAPAPASAPTPESVPEPAHVGLASDAGLAPKQTADPVSQRDLDPDLMKFVRSQISAILNALPDEAAREDFAEAMRRNLGATPVASAPASAQPAQQVQQTPPKPVLDLSKFGVKKNYAGVLPAGYRAESPGLLYSPHANLDQKTNKPRILEVLAVDVSQWGNQPVIVAIPATDVRVLMPDGTIFDNVETETDTRVPIVIFVDGDCTNIHRDLLENPDYGIVCCWVPSFEQPMADGTAVMRHLVGRAESIPKKGIWPPE
jgi:hypothetical protein